MGTTTKYGCTRLYCSFGSGNTVVAHTAVAPTSPANTSSLADHSDTGGSDSTLLNHAVIMGKLSANTMPNIVPDHDGHSHARGESELEWLPHHTQHTGRTVVVQKRAKVPVMQLCQAAARCHFDDAECRVEP